MNNAPVPIKDLLADVMGAKGLVGVPPEIAEDAMRKTAIDFCTQSTIWEFEDGFDTQVNVADYPIFVPEGARLASMKWVAVDGTILRPNTTGYRPIQGWSRTLNPDSFYSWQGNGFTFTMQERDAFWITPVPMNDCCCQQVTFCAALKPTQEACELPFILTEDWRDAITSGAAYRLFAMPKQEWSNGALAMQNQREYSRSIARARLTKMQNYTQYPGIASGSYF